MESFVPGPESARAYRDALGAYATGVTVVTTQTERGPLGMTANSFASVSLDPPLVLWSPAKASLRFPAFTQAKHYAIHILDAAQADVCFQFSKEGEDFAGIDWSPCPLGRPLIENCLVRLECETHAIHDGGDHQIVVGLVSKVTTNAGDPLLFSRGKLGKFQGQ